MTIQQFVDWVTEVWTSIKDFFAGIWQGIKDVFAVVAELVYGNFQAVGRYFVCLECRYRLVLKSVDRNQRHFFCSRKLVWRYIYNCVDKYKIGVFGYSTIFQGFVDCNKSPFIKVADWFKDIFSKAWQAVKDVIFDLVAKF